MKLDMEVGLSPGQCVRWGPTSPSWLVGWILTSLFSNYIRQ